MRIGIIGSGYVGLVTGACFAEYGVHVVCMDRDEKKIKSLKSGKVPFFEPGLDDLVAKNIKKGRLQFTSRMADAVNSSQVVFIAVGTPPRGDGSADLGYVEEVAREIAAHLDDYKVIVTKSTVPVGTGSKLKKLISAHLKNETSFDVASNPEFLREGSAIEDFMRPNRVVIGSDNPRAEAVLMDLYRPLYLIETPIVRTDIETAELIKYASNSFLAVKISFINEMARLCELIGADVHMVAKGMGLDRRIGPKFLHPGPGFGGSCFPKDTRALLNLAKEHGLDLEIVGAAVGVNETQKSLMLRKIKETLGPVKGKTIAVLGLSFKPNTDDMREAPSARIISGLMEDGAHIRAYDPIVTAGHASRFLPKGVFYAENPYDAAKGADAAVLVTEWNEFRNLELGEIKKLMKSPNFFDLRNVYEVQKMLEAGFAYYSVGRPSR
ncbi:MAG: UDP-glucose/GDP-mannose dehydrogenase family protein [Actinomycetota bacterium]|nr:UDP-glucose/GDP-mannose dehydrogenase family protein [Actinomycetota bacterium]